MNRIALVIGHGPRIDKGAFSTDGQTHELGWNGKLVPLIAQKIEDAGGHPFVIHRAQERNPPTTLVNLTGAEVACEFHLNSADGPASGTEMIHYPGSKKGILLATAMQMAAVGELGLANRGIKPPWQGRGMVFLAKTHMPAIIVESFFISNDNDLARGNDKLEELARAYAATLLGLRWS